MCCAKFSKIQCKKSGATGQKWTKKISATVCGKIKFAARIFLNRHAEKSPRCSAHGAGAGGAKAGGPAQAHRARRRRSRCRPSGASQQAQGGGQVGRRKSTGKGAKTPRSLPNFLPQQNPHKIHTFGQKFICVLRKKNKKIAHRKICTLLKIFTFKITR